VLLEELFLSSLRITCVASIHP